MPNIPELYATYATNCARFPALYEELASQLGVSTASLIAIGAGFCPLDDFGNWAWVWPERKANGDIVGLSKRLQDGKKFMVKGSKRGLLYTVNRDTAQYEKRQWTRVSTDCPCPLCGKPDGCLYPEGEYDKPNAVICVHIATGSAKPMKLGHLHILDPARQKLQMKNYSILLPSDHPILVVEGASDVCAAYDLGFTAVGKPSAASKSKDLVDLLSGHQCVILGENDAGAGKAGMEFTFTQLQLKCPECTKLMPPEGVKDLRQWVEKGLTQAGLLKYIKETGSQVRDANILDNDEPLTVAGAWIEKHKTIKGKIAFGIYRKGYVNFNGAVYEELSDDQVYGQLYRNIGGLSYMDAAGFAKPYKLNCSKVRDILQACRSSCLIDKDAPAWLTPGDHPDPSRLIVFRNGILDVDEYVAGNIKFHKPTPDYFTFSALPYDFNETLNSALWYDTRYDIFQENENKLRLLAQWFGINLVPDMSFQKLMMFKGLTGTGKGTVAAALQAMLGDNNCCITSFLSLSGDHGFGPLVGKLCAVVTDAVASSSREEKAVLAKLLTVVGADSIIVNPKGKPHLPKVKLCCRFTFAMNDFPMFRDDSRSLERRTNILTFNNSYVGRENTTLRDRLEKEASQGKLINYALGGLKDLYTSRKFVVPAESAVAIASLRQLVSPVSHFAQYCVKLDVEGPGVATDELYDLWKWWCVREGAKWGKKIDLIRTLQSTIPNTIRIMEGEVGNPDQMLMGIKVTEWAREGQAKG